jgi:hypothetical protein
MLKGHSDPLNSSFHLSYNMLLNTMRLEWADERFLDREGIRIEWILRYPQSRKGQPPKPTPDSQ